MFGNGIKTTPSTAFKLKSNLIQQSLLMNFYRELSVFQNFYFLEHKQNHSHRKRLCLLQEFIPNVDYDLKIAVVRNKLSFVARGTRPGEFRASGGGTLFYDKTLVTKALSIQHSKLLMLWALSAPV